MENIIVKVEVKKLNKDLQSGTINQLQHPIWYLLKNVMIKNLSKISIVKDLIVKRKVYHIP